MVDHLGLERLAVAAKGGAIKRPSDGKEVKSVVFVQCAGQRDTTGKHLPYCSGSCCNTSIKQAMYFKDANPDIDTMVMYTVLRCPSPVNTIWITDALNGGWDGVMMMGCKKGDDYQCHFVKGSEMASYRMSKVDDTLKQMGLETERVASYEVAITDIERVPQLINEYAEKIKEIGMSPMKGFA